MSFRAWLSVVTLVLLGIIIYFARHELVHAWLLLENVNIWILLLLIPGQLLVYYAAGEMIFSYLRQKQSIASIPPLRQAQMSLEMNFVNHVLPSGGVSGVSYMGWRLSKYGVSAGRATMAQVVRFAMGFVAFMLLLVISVLAVTIDGDINRWIILVSATLVGGMGSLMFGCVFLISNERRIQRFSRWISRVTNKLVARITFGRVKNVADGDKIDTFFKDIHDDFMQLRADKRMLIKPLIWGLIFTVADVALFMITFWALGVPVNPAPILIAYGVASVAGFFVITPGGAGAYEAIMVLFLAVAGVAQGTAIAGIVLTRVILLLGTIGLGYVFYQHSLIKYGKAKQS